MSRICPDDGSILERRAFHGLILDVCSICAGVYFDEGEMAALQAGGTRVLHEVESSVVSADLIFADCDAPKHCPGCGALMCAYNYRYSSEIRLDGCDQCGGVWVQDGELADIAAHLRATPTAFGGASAARRHLLTLHAATSHFA